MIFADIFVRRAAADWPGRWCHLHTRHRLRVGPGARLLQIRQEEDVAFSGWANRSESHVKFNGVQIATAVSDTSRNCVMMTCVWLSADVLSMLGARKARTVLPFLRFTAPIRLETSENVLRGSVLPSQGNGEKLVNVLNLQLWWFCSCETADRVQVSRLWRNVQH